MTDPTASISSNPFDPGYFTEEQLRHLGFRSVGIDVRIARSATIIGLGNISLGDHVRIDGYTSLIASDPGWITLGSYIHIGAYCLLSAGDGIELADFSGLSHGVMVYSRTDDYTGRYLTNPTVPGAFTRTSGGTVRLGRHVIIGSGSVILPRLTIGEGCSVGAQSLVTKSLEPWGVYFGSPVKRLKERSQRLLTLEAALLQGGPVPVSDSESS